jgi:hypothetical protein
MFLLRQPFPEQHQRHVEAGQGIAQQYTDMHHEFRWHVVGQQGPGQIDCMCQRQHGRYMLQHWRQPVDRKKHATQQHHRGDSQREVVHEIVIAGGEGGDDQPDRRETQADQKCERNDPQRQRRVRQSQQITSSTARPDSRLLLAAQTISENTMSSSVMGVLSIASQVRCSCMRAKPEYSASKLALFMVL